MAAFQSGDRPVWGECRRSLNGHERKFGNEIAPP